MFCLLFFKPDNFLYGTLNVNENFIITFAVMKKKGASLFFFFPSPSLYLKPLLGRLVCFQNRREPAKIGCSLSTPNCSYSNAFSAL